VGSSILGISICDDRQDAVMVQAAFIGLVLVAGLVQVAVLSACTIVPERQARTLPLLLATPLSEWEIVQAKALGVLRKTSPTWALLAVQVLVFTVLGSLSAGRAMLVMVVALGAVAFVLGVGIYFSTRVGSTSVAVLAALVTATLLWLGLPVIVMKVFPFMRYLEDASVSDLGLVLAALPVVASPVSQIVMALSIAPAGVDLLLGHMSTVVGVVAVIYMGLGWLMALRARHRLRRELF